MAGIDQSIMTGGLALAATVLIRGVPYDRWSLQAFENLCQVGQYTSV